MADPKISQKQLSEKYGIGQGIISMCLENVPYETVRTKGARRPTHFYNEVDALFAIRAHYQKRSEDVQKEADDYSAKADACLDAITKIVVETD